VKRQSVSRRLAAGVLALCASLALPAVPAAADATHHPLWVVKGEKNKVYLLGSIHVLRPSDYPLPDVLESAYRDADVLYMEVDLDDLDQAAAVAFTMSRGMLGDDRSLADVLGRKRYASAQEQADALGVDLELFARFEPWVAALTVIQAQLGRLGLEADQGIEHHFMREAQKDHKEIRGLETVADQLGVLDDLPLDRQGDFLMMSLEDAESMPKELDELITEWRAGDAEGLAATLEEEFGGFPELYERLIAARNRNWAVQIEQLLDDNRDYLVVVGALHLVGKDSVLELLGKRARVRQL
jgi:uncharacterized protein YbaP (TraB family)